MQLSGPTYSICMVNCWYYGKCKNPTIRNDSVSNLALTFKSRRFAALQGVCAYFLGLHILREKFSHKISRLARDARLLVNAI